MALGEWSVQWLYDELRAARRRPDHADVVDAPPHRPGGAPARTGSSCSSTTPQPERITAWIVLDRGEASVCNQHPGYDSDVVVTCTSATLSGVFNGVESWGHAIATGSIRVEGPPRFTKALPRWFPGSAFDQLVAARAAMVDSER